MAIEKTPATPYPAADWAAKPKNPLPPRGYTKHTVLASEKSLVDVGARSDVGMSWSELTDFNWGTTDPGEINWYLKRDAGCTVETSDKKNYVFIGGEKLWIPTPAPVAPPPVAPAAPVAPKAVSTATTSTTIATSHKDGDILLRAGVEDWIMELVGGRFSHAGICSKGATHMAVDALPAEGAIDPAHRATGNNVAEGPIAGFFNKINAPGGGEVHRYIGDKAKAVAAARWAEGECGKPYFFDIMDPIIGPAGSVEDNNSLYCSEFVWRCYRDGAGVVLVPRSQFINLLSPAAQKAKTIRILRESIAVDEHPVAARLFKRKTDAEILKRIGSHNGEFVAPHQLATSTKTKLYHTIKRGGSSSGTSKK